MRYLYPALLGVMFALGAAPAFAQMSGMGGGAGGAPKPQPVVPDIVPPALPGAGNMPLATAPTMQAPQTGDPTTQLFSAINSGDYDSAQDALSRGANLYARNALDETPLELAIALNRTTITFLLLQTRNETGGDLVGPGPAAEATAGSTQGAPGKPQMMQRADTGPGFHEAAPVMGNNPGTPDPQSGFLGFGPKS